MTYEEIRDLIGQVLALDEQATAGPWTHYRRANTKPSEWPAWALADVEDEEEQRITAEGEPNDIALIATYRTAAPTLARELQRLLAEHADGAWVFAADLRRALEGKKAVGNDPLVLQVQRFRMEYSNLLADADASQHWRTRALRAEAVLEKARSDLRLATDPKPDDLLGVRLVNGCASLPDDTPEWVALLLREAWTAIRVLRADAEGKAARIASLDEEVERLHAELEEVRTALERVTAERDEAERLQRVDEGTLADVHETLSPLFPEPGYRQPRPTTADLAVLLVERLEEARLTLAAEQGDPAGAPDPAWTWMGDGWEREYPCGERAAVYHKRWYRASMGQPARAHGQAQTMRAGMIASDKDTP